MKKSLNIIYGKFNISSLRVHSLVGLLMLAFIVFLLINGCNEGETANTNDLPEVSTESPPKATEETLPENVPVRSSADDCRQRASSDPYDEVEDAEDIYNSCREAADLMPEDAEIIYLAASSALQIGRSDEALLGFQNSLELGYCQANYLLGDHSWHVEKNVEKAEAYYKQGAQCGDERAAREIFSPAVFASSANPELIEALYKSDIEKLNRLRFVTASYVYGLVSETGEQYLGTDFKSCWKQTHYSGGEILNDLIGAENGNAGNVIEGATYEAVLPLIFQAMYPDLGSKALEVRRESNREAGKADLLRLVESASCDSLVAYKIMTGIKLFAKSRRSLYETGKEIAPEANSVFDIPEIIRKNGISTNQNITKE